MNRKSLVFWRKSGNAPRGVKDWHAEKSGEAEYFTRVGLHPDLKDTVNKYNNLSELADIGVLLADAEYRDYLSKHGLPFEMPPVPEDKSRINDNGSTFYAFCESAMSNLDRTDLNPDKIDLKRLNKLITSKEYELKFLTEIRNEGEKQRAQESAKQHAEERVKKRAQDAQTQMERDKRVAATSIYGSLLLLLVLFPMVLLASVLLTWPWETDMIIILLFWMGCGCLVMLLLWNLASKNNGSGARSTKIPSN